MSVNYDDAWSRAREGSPFSNSSMWEWWAERWCYRCANDGIGINKELPQCPLIAIALNNRTPAEWLTETEEQAVLGDFRCIEFRNRDDPGSYEPKPVPDPPGQLLLLPREPFEGVRMWAAAPERESVTA
jgi:hypothetical protein